MTKLIGFVLWAGSLLSAALFGLAIYAGEFSGTEGFSGYFIGIIVSLILCGIGRRIFNIPKSLVEKKGLLPAILSRINCPRFYWSIVWYAVLVFTADRVVRVLTTSFEEGLLGGIVGLFLCGVAHYILRRTCPRCGADLTSDGTGDYGAYETTIGDSYYETTQKYSEYCHCPRCGRKVSIRQKRTVGKGSW